MSVLAGGFSSLAFTWAAAKDNGQNINLDTGMKAFFKGCCLAFSALALVSLGGGFLLFLIASVTAPATFVKGLYDYSEGRKRLGALEAIFGVLGFINLYHTAQSLDSAVASQFMPEKDSVEDQYVTGTKNGGSETTTLGKYVTPNGEANYIVQAGNDSSYFDMGDEYDRVLEAIMKELNISKEEGYKYMFKNYNAPFIDQGCENNNIFYFTSDPTKATGALREEYLYLLEHDYELHAANPFPNSSEDTTVYYMIPKES